MKEKNRRERNKDREWDEKARNMIIIVERRKRKISFKNFCYDTVQKTSKSVYHVYESSTFLSIPA